MGYVLHDYRCTRCGTTGEMYVPNNPVPGGLPCACGGHAKLVFLQAPGIGNPSKGKYPYYDTQLGVMLESAQHRDRVAKERGLAIMGVEEFNRSKNAAPESSEMPFDSAAWKEAAQESLRQMRYQEVPLEAAPVIEDEPVVATEVSDAPPEPGQ